MKTSLWLSVDPLAEKMPNYGAYVFTFNNPINYTDPTGMEPDPPSTLYTNTNNAKGVIESGFNANKYGKYSNYNWFSTSADSGGTGRTGQGTTLGIDGINTSNAVEVSNSQMKNFYNAAKSELGFTSEQIKSSADVRSKVDGLKFEKLGKWMDETGASVYKVGKNYAVSDAAANKGIINSIRGSAGSINALKGLKIAGKTLLFVGIALDAYEIHSSGYNPRTISGVAGGWAGAWAGAKVGGAIGTGIGIWIGGVGEVVTAPAGAIIGGIGGYFGGKAASQIVYDKITTKGVPVGGK